MDPMILLILIVLSPIILLIGVIGLFYAIVIPLEIILTLGFGCWRVYMMFFESKKLERYDRLMMLRELRKAQKNYRSNRNYINSNKLTIDNIESMKLSKKERDEASVKIREIRASLEAQKNYHS